MVEVLIEQVAWSLLILRASTPTSPHHRPGRVAPSPHRRYEEPPYPAGSTFSKTTTSAVTWNAGVMLVSKIGIDLTARGGYSSSIKNSFSFSNSKRLCGEWAGPGGTSGRLTVKPS